MTSLVRFAVTRPPRPRCSWCYRQAQGAFHRRNKKTLHACPRHFGKGMGALIKHSGSAGG